jgi:hypothetical protein
MKIDAVRTEQVQRSCVDNPSPEGEFKRPCRKSAFRAGGIDGGFQTQEELLELLR